MTTTIANNTLVLSELANPPNAMIEAGPAWLRRARESALASFLEQGLPTTRHEEWRFTNVAPIARTRFRLAPRDVPTPTPRLVERVGIGLDDALRLVFVDGRPVPGLSSTPTALDGVEAMSLAEAVRTRPDLVEPHLARYADAAGDAFTALNTALFEDGGFVHVARGALVEHPIVLLNIASARGEPIVTQPRNLVVVEESAEVTIVEDYVCLDDQVYLNNAVTEMIVGAGATATHYLLERESRRAFNISTLRVQQQRDSNFSSHSVMLGGAIVRNNVELVLDGENCECTLNGLYLPAKDQLIDNHMHVVHAKPHCSSRQYYKGVIADNGRAVFTGRIIVAQDAQRTDAVQMNDNLLLSENAQVDTQPQLEIYADDVRCTHGATIGQIDENAVFYLRSRAMTEQAARALLVYAFASESLERMALDPVREHLRVELLSRLPEGELLRASI